MNLVESKFFELSLGEAGVSGVLSNGRAWQCSCTFPVPENDMLLHMTLTGGRRFYPFEQPLHQLVADPHIHNLVNYNNILQRSNPGMRLEALASAGIAVASIEAAFVEYHSHSLWGRLFTSWASTQLSSYLWIL